MYNGSSNMLRRPDYEGMNEQKNMAAYKGSLRDLQIGMEYSELGLNQLQYKIANSNSVPVQQPLQIPLHHPLHGKNNGSLFRMNNAPVIREPAHDKSVTVIDEDIELPTTDGRTGKLLKGEQVLVIKMSNQTFLKRTTGPAEILNATCSKHHYPRANVVANNRIIDNSVVELD